VRGGRALFGLRSVQLAALVLGHVGQRCALAVLQGADVGDDRPAVLRVHLGAVVLHPAESVGDHIEVVAGRLVAHLLVVERRRRPQAALHDHAVAHRRAAVAGRTVDIEPLVPALQHLVRHLERELIDELAVHLPGEHQLVVVQVPARDGALDQRPHAASVGERVGFLVRIDARRVVHVLTAGRGKHDERQHDRGPEGPPRSFFTQQRR
jgi:hypothetical protein